MLLGTEGGLIKTILLTVTMISFNDSTFIEFLINLTAKTRLLSLCLQVLQCFIVTDTSLLTAPVHLQKKLVHRRYMFVFVDMCFVWDCDCVSE